MGSAIRFLLNGDVRTVDDAPPERTLLEYVRETARLTGTKEGCAEGDCGACTVALGTRDGATVRYRPVNSCIVLLGQVHGRQVLTVEALAGGDALHPVQQALVDAHGTQCGFCTPGFAMAMFALHQEGGTPDVDSVHEALAGNLCRCTGYRPIVEAAQRAASLPDAGQRERLPGWAATLGTLDDGGDLAVEGAAGRFLAPTTMDGLAAALAAHPDARILAGGTDLALLVTKQNRRLGTVVALGRVAGLDRIEVGEATITLGAAATYADALPVIAADRPDFAAMIRRLGSRQIRALGTVVGNVANASPIGDTPPVLLALDATLDLVDSSGARTMKIADFFTDYRRTALRRGEFVASVTWPRAVPGELFAVYKVSRRWDQDISAVLGAFRLVLDGDVVAAARIAYGGMAATPKLAVQTAAALVGRPWTEATVEAAIPALAADFSPIDDFRASAAYRARIAGNLLRRFHRATTSPADTAGVMAL
ncbi:MAG: xanthine dehydrogenase small subunit [Alphaproteobacteria bacterium]